MSSFISFFYDVIRFTRRVWWRARVRCRLRWRSCSRSATCPSYVSSDLTAVMRHILSNHTSVNTSLFYFKMTHYTPQYANLTPFIQVLSEFKFDFLFRVSFYLRHPSILLAFVVDLNLHHHGTLQQVSCVLPGLDSLCLIDLESGELMGKLLCGINTLTVTAASALTMINTCVRIVYFSCQP